MTKQSHQYYCVVQRDYQFAEAAQPKLQGPEQLAWLDRLETELDNVRAALDFSLAGGGLAEAEAGLRLAAALTRFWVIRSHWREAYAWFEAALALPRAPARSLVRAEAMNAAHSMAHWEVDVAQRRSQMAECVAIFREAGPPGRRGLAYALITLGGLTHFQGDFAPTLTMLKESVGLFRELGDPLGAGAGPAPFGGYAGPTRQLSVSRRAGFVAAARAGARGAQRPHRRARAF